MIPDLPRSVRGEYQAMCGRCMRHSGLTPAPGNTEAWAALQALGWTLYQASPQARAYPLCGRCDAKLHSIDLAAAEARRRRKKR